MKRAKQKIQDGNSIVEDDDNDVFAMNNSYIKQKCTPIKNKAPSVMETSNKDLKFISEFQMTRATSPQKV